MLLLTGCGGPVAGVIATAPELISATISAGGDTLVTVWDQAVNWANGGTLYPIGYPEPFYPLPAPDTGDGTSTLTFFGVSFSPALPLVLEGDEFTIDFAEGTVAGVSGGLNNAAINGASVTNNSTQQPDLLTGLIGYWRFQNDLTDSSGNGNTLPQYSGTAGYAAGKIDQGITNGSPSSYQYLVGLAVPTTYTIAFWFRIADAATGSEVDLYHTDETAFVNIGVTVNGGGFDFLAGDFGGTQVTATGQALNTWYHVVVTSTGAGGTLELFVNGVSKGTAATAVTCYALYPGLGGGNRIDEMALYDIVLNQAQIDALYNAGTGFDPTV